MVIIFKKDKKGSTEAEMCHAIVYAREFCLWDRYWGRTNHLWEHYFFSASSIPRKYLQILTGPSFVLTSKVANSFYQYSSSFSFSVPDIKGKKVFPRNFSSFPWEIHTALQIGLKDNKPTGDTLFL